MAFSLVRIPDLCEPLFYDVDIHDPGMRIGENTRNKGFTMIFNWFIFFAHSWIKNTSIYPSFQVPSASPGFPVPACFRFPETPKASNQMSIHHCATHRARHNWWIGVGFVRVSKDETCIWSSNWIELKSFRLVEFLYTQALIAVICVCPIWGSDWIVVWIAPP